MKEPSPRRSSMPRRALLRLGVGCRADAKIDHLGPFSPEILPNTTLKRVTNFQNTFIPNLGFY